MYSHRRTRPKTCCCAYLTANESESSCNQRTKPWRSRCIGRLEIRTRTRTSTRTRCRLCFRVCWRLPDLVILSLHILYRFYCVICTSARFHEPLCVHVRHPHGPSLHISCMRYLYIRPISRTSVRMSECVKRVTRSEYFGNFLLLSRVSSSALIVHSVVCMSVILYGRDSFCTVVRGRNLVVRRRADDAAFVRELPYRISVQYSYGTRTP